MGDTSSGEGVFSASELENFAANEIQRCFRGYKVRQRVSFYSFNDVNSLNGAICKLWLSEVKTVKFARVAVALPEVEEKAIGRGSCDIDPSMLQGLLRAPVIPVGHRILVFSSVSAEIQPFSRRWVGNRWV